MFIGATFKGKNMLPLFVPLIVASFKTWVPLYGNKPYRSKVVFDDMDTNIITKDMFPFIAYCVNEFKIVFGGLIFLRFLFCIAKSVK